jgi:hypothetical protein
LKLIRENSTGIDEETLMKKLETSEENFERVLPRILRLKNISDEVKLVNGVYKNIIKEIKEDDVKGTVTEDIVVNLAYKMTREFKRTHKSNGEYQERFIDQKLKIELIKRYEKLRIENKSKKISNLCKQYSNHSKMTILRHLTTPIRLPTGLQELERTGGLGMQWQISLTIALCACDYYDWDGEKENEEKVGQLAKDIWNYLKNDNYLMDLLRVK